MKKPKKKLDEVMSMFYTYNHGYSSEDAAMMLQRYKKHIYRQWLKFAKVVIQKKMCPAKNTMTVSSMELNCLESTLLVCGIDSGCE